MSLSHHVLNGHNNGRKACREKSACKEEPVVPQVQNMESAYTPVHHATTSELAWHAMREFAELVNRNTMIAIQISWLTTDVRAAFANRGKRDSSENTLRKPIEGFLAQLGLEELLEDQLLTDKAVNNNGVFEKLSLEKQQERAAQMLEICMQDAALSSYVSDYHKRFQDKLHPENMNHPTKEESLLSDSST